MLVCDVVCEERCVRLRCEVCMMGLFVLVCVCDGMWLEVMGEVNV